jgi:hypothetical protein
VIEKITVADGDVVLRVDGRLLGSRVDPKAEARAFVDKRRPLLADVKSVFVLGLASGHHVRELTRRTPAHLVVLEPRADVIAANADAFDSARVTILHTPDARLDAPFITAALLSSYLVIIHPASRSLSPALYDQWAMRLGAREPGALADLWARRAWAMPAGGFGASADPLTIHDLSKFEIGDEATRTRALVRALKELVR